MDDDVLDRLYTAPLSEFVAERDKLAKELRAAGDRESAKEVKALTRPSVAAWVVNQLAYSEREMIERLLACGDELRAIQSGTGSADELQAATAARRDWQAALMERATTILVASGNAATDATLKRVGTTIDVLATYGTTETAPRLGRLSRELEPLGFDSLAQLATMPVPSRRTSTTPGAREIATSGPKPEAGAPQPQQKRRVFLTQLPRKSEEVVEKDSKEATRPKSDRKRKAAAIERQKRLVEARRATLAAKRHTCDEARSRSEEAVDELATAERNHSQRESDRTSADRAVADAAREVSETQRRLDEAKTRARLAHTELERTTFALAGARASEESARAMLARAEADIETTEAQLAEAEGALED